MTLNHHHYVVDSTLLQNLTNFAFFDLIQCTASRQKTADFVQDICNNQVDTSVPTRTCLIIHSIGIENIYVLTIKWVAYIN